MEGVATSSEDIAGLLAAGRLLLGVMLTSQTTSFAALLKTEAPKVLLLLRGMSSPETPPLFGISPETFLGFGVGEGREGLEAESKLESPRSLLEEEGIKDGGPSLLEEEGTKGGGASLLEEGTKGGGRPLHSGIGVEPVVFGDAIPPTEKASVPPPVLTGPADAFGTRLFKRAPEGAPTDPAKVAPDEIDARDRIAAALGPIV
mmetsp:Transcript_25856/g.43364  ORF Transcript_25856/g.43364 Transcript_25856/m.43364 type:complete len:203 (+) Transcript_25856:1592-2200(+)